MCLHTAHTHSHTRTRAHTRWVWVRFTSKTNLNEILIDLFLFLVIMSLWVMSFLFHYPRFGWCPVAAAAAFAYSIKSWASPNTPLPLLIPARTFGWRQFPPCHAVFYDYDTRTSQPRTHQPIHVLCKLSLNVQISPIPSPTCPMCARHIQARVESKICCVDELRTFRPLDTQFIIIKIMKPSCENIGKFPNNKTNAWHTSCMSHAGKRITHSHTHTYRLREFTTNDRTIGWVIIE